MYAFIKYHASLLFRINQCLLLGKLLNMVDLNKTAQLEKFISSPRLNSYKVIIGNDNTTELIGAYNWNKNVSTTIYPILQCLEITLRNALNLNIKDHFNMSDWYSFLLKKGGDKKFIEELKEKPDLGDSFYRNGISIGPRNSRKRWNSYHENMLKSTKKRLQNAGKTANSNAIVAELMFGFWVGLFEQSYRDIDADNSIWPHIESSAFPNLSPQDRNSSLIHTKLLELKTLRNRISHHEPVWKFSTVIDKESAISYLHDRINDALFIIKGISIDRHDYLVNSGKVINFKNVCSLNSLNNT